jgi:hypothetical protein
MSLLTNLDHHWRLTDDGTWADSVGGGTALTESGTVGAATGLVYANAADFPTTANNDDLLSNSVAAGGGNTAFTAAVWVRLDAVNGSVTSAFALTARASGSTSWFVSVNTTVTAGDSKVRARFDDVGGDQVSVQSAADLSVNTWYRLAVRFDPTADTWTLSVNGTHGTPVATGAFFPRSGVDSFTVGGFLDGRVGPVDLWSRALSDAELDAHYNAGAGLPYESYGGGGGGTKSRPIFRRPVRFFRGR